MPIVLPTGENRLQSLEMNARKISILIGMVMGLNSIFSTVFAKDCPVLKSDLETLQIPYIDYSGAPATGSLVVHRLVAKEVGEIFSELKQEGFRIQKMLPIEHYGGSDFDSISDDNTSAFNCREMTNNSDRFSNHAFGLAIDINPFRNPWVELRNGKEWVARKATLKYLNRTLKVPGLIQADGPVVKIFKAHGWIWGGTHAGSVYPKDYQHFEKVIPEIGNSASWK